MKKWFAIFGASIIAVAACGARSSLPVDEPPEVIEDAGPDIVDARPDVADARPDVVINDCQDAGITYIYLISGENELIRFYPPDLSVTTIGTIDCPVPEGETPFSMAVDRSGVAYVVFSGGELFRVSTLTASCKETDFLPNQLGFNTVFGMGFSANTDDPDETLFVAGADLMGGGLPQPIGTIDVTTFELSMVGTPDKFIGNPELTGTGDGRLFAFGPGSPSSHLAELDKTNAEVLSDDPIELGNPGSFFGWAFAFWGGDFYFFTSEAGGFTNIHKYTPGGPSTLPIVQTINGLTIVGAGVSTCAPSR